MLLSKKELLNLKINSFNILSQKPKIFYFCFSQDNISGGSKEIYRHVDILNQNGYEAYVIHTISNFRLKWFENETKVIYWDDFLKIYNENIDFVVLPEDLDVRILTFPGKNKVIFHQGLYHGFRAYGWKKIEQYPYLHPDIKAVMVVSEHSKKTMQFMYPEQKIYRVKCGVDLNKFSYKLLKEKQKIISCNPDKRPLDISLLFHMLKSREAQKLNALNEFEWSFIYKKNEFEVIKILQDSLIFIFLSREEGFGLMPIEAMACGALVFSFDTYPLKEFIPSEFLFEPSDFTGMAEKIEFICNDYQKNMDYYQNISQKGFEIARQYSLQEEKKSLLDVWNDII